jgi:putative hydrolase of HD superfamily
MKKKEVIKLNSEAKKMVNFLFETRILKYIPRAGLQYLKGPIKENLAEHTFYVTMIAWILAKMEKVNEEKVIKMALIHDLAEGRGGDRNLINKIYGGKINEIKLVEEISRDHELEEFQMRKLIKELFEGKTKEAKIVEDADHLAEMFWEKENLDMGNRKAKRWLDFHLLKLKTKNAKILGKLLIETDSDEWWLKIVEKYTGYKISLI